LAKTSLEKGVIMHSTSVLSALLLSFLTLWGCGNNQASTKTSPSPASTDTTASPSTQGKQSIKIPSQSVAIGQSVKLGKYQFTVHGTRKTQGDTISKPKQGQKFLLIYATVENQGQKTEPVSSVVLFALTDSTGKEYERVITTEAQGSLDTNLDPGKQLKGEIAFEVPQDAKDLLLILRGDLVEPNLQAQVKLN
jgi:uncharacterized cupredoxin-like copper-binding protein